MPPKLLPVPEALEVKVERKHSSLEHAAESTLTPELPLAVDDLKGEAVCQEEGGRGGGGGGRSLGVGQSEHAQNKMLLLSLDYCILGGYR